MTTEIIDEDDWVEIERPVKKPSGVVADVSIKITAARYKNGTVGTPRTYLFFRGEAAAWIEERGPRFRVQIGGRFHNNIRVVPDLQGGKYENTLMLGVQRLILGIVPVWPAEERPSMAVEWDCAKDWMRLTLPQDFAKPRGA